MRAASRSSSIFTGTSSPITRSVDGLTLQCPRSGAACVGGMTAWVLPQSAELAFFSAHAILDHRFRLVLFRDLSEMTRRGLDWNDVLEFSNEYGLRSIVWSALTAARLYADADIPESVLEALSVGSLAERVFARQLTRIDPVRFDGRSMHPLNLASVLLHDDFRDRLALVKRAPTAFEGWRKTHDDLPPAWPNTRTGTGHIESTAWCRGLWRVDSHRAGDSRMGRPIHVPVNRLGSDGRCDTCIRS